PLLGPAIEPILRLHSMTPRFVADCNVGRLARWLRALGYDASYHAHIGDGELVREGAAESRVLLTRDRDLMKRRVIQSGVVRAVLIRDDEVTAQLRRLQLEELGGRARLDLGRLVRRGVPEVVLAPGKSPDDAARLVIATAARQGQGLVSRMSGEHRAVLDEQATRSGMDVPASTSSARGPKPGFLPPAVAARVGSLTG